MIRPIGSPKMQQAHAFLVQVETNGRAFAYEELMQASGWAASHTKGIIAKKLPPHLQKVDGGYKVVGIMGMSLDAFCRLCSQTAALASDPLRPRLPYRVEGLVKKAQEAALAAVQHYNNPTSKFRSANYIILMVIAYTSLFHAIFEQDGVDYVEYKDNSTPKLTGDCDLMRWDMLKSAKFYAKTKPASMTAVITNLELMFSLRNKIEHQFIPQLDPDICGHCQSMLLNFEEILVKEFTSYFALNTSLAMALQFSTQRPPEVVAAQRRLVTAEYEAVKQYLTEFQTRLPDEILQDPAFAWRVYFIQKTANHIKSSDLCLEFIPANAVSPELQAELDKRAVAVKRVEREVRSRDYLLPAQVCARVEKAIGRRFSTHHHTLASRADKIRPIEKDSDRANTDTRYCVWDKTFQRHVYTEEWVEKLIAKYADADKYEALCRTKRNGSA